jgi:hypothetical protein
MPMRLPGLLLALLLPPLAAGSGAYAARSCGENMPAAAAYS